MGDVASVLQRTYTLLQEILPFDVDPPDDGAWEFTYGSVPLVVSVFEREGDDEVVVFVGSQIIRDVPKTEELLDTLNLMNSGMHFGHAYWREGNVFAVANLVGETLDALELQKAMNTVGDWSDKVDEAFAERFGPQRGGPPPPPPGVITGR